ncbi:MAG: hypothetical protein ONA90_04685, partial [candidate division KSB1 bacterium]|nr:hypothetical protein [candidate division KSB1 bacterium]
DKSQIPAHVAVLQQNLPFPDRPVHEELSTAVKLFRGEMEAFVDMCAKQVEHRQKSGKGNYGFRFRGYDNFR